MKAVLNKIHKDDCRRPAHDGWPSEEWLFPCTCEPQNCVDYIFVEAKPQGLSYEAAPETAFVCDWWQREWERR